jgi:hypothetical protein
MPRLLLLGIVGSLDHNSHANSAPSFTGRRLAAEYHSKQLLLSKHVLCIKLIRGIGCMDRMSLSFVLYIMVIRINGCLRGQRQCVT